MCNALDPFFIVVQNMKRDLFPWNPRPLCKHRVFYICLRGKETQLWNGIAIIWIYLSKLFRSIVRIEMHWKTMIDKKWSGCWQGRVRSVSGQIKSLFKCCGKGVRLAVASRPLCEVALQVKSMRQILQLWCLVQVISLISAAPRQEGNFRASEGNGIINFRCEVKKILRVCRW